MSQISPLLDAAILAQVEQAKRDTAKVFRVLKDSRTLTATNTFQAHLRVPGTDLVIALATPSPWDDDQSIRAVVASYDGVVHLDEYLAPGVALGESRQGGVGKRYASVLQQRPEVNVVIHVHTPYLGGWAGAHRALPLDYAAAQRVTLARELPVYIDRRQPESAFIVQVIEANPHTPAILEANGGATFWGEGILKSAKWILLFEEGAYFQTLAEAVGGGKPFGPGVLEQQWRMSGLWEQGRALIAEV
ncbi:class II aldolase/adducin family protein [Pseudomonas sichuanensis]|uniref:class II aldolase/adducin family protein n=1 Tax=Pseudomonas sichuanensis TaxID=2213015 RepID=UPI000DA64809|nr:class II aldolase/adducin family protein [Pseudomonas sichuanensis]